MRDRGKMIIHPGNRRFAPSPARASSGTRFVAPAPRVPVGAQPTHDVRADEPAPPVTRTLLTQLLPEPVDGQAQPFINVHLRLPPEQGTRPADIGLADFGVV